MNSEKIFRAVGDVGDDLIARADIPMKKKHNVIWLRWTALAACCVLIVGIAAFARLVLGGAKSAAPEANSAQSTADCAAPEAPAETQDYKSESDFESPAESVPAEAEEAPAEVPAAEEAPAEMPAEEPESELTDNTAAYEESFAESAALRTIVFDGRSYTELSGGEADLQPGEQLGSVESSADEALTGCEVYACEGEAPEARVLVLLDGRYLAFECTE